MSISVLWDSDVDQWVVVWDSDVDQCVVGQLCRCGLWCGTAMSISR